MTEKYLTNQRFTDFDLAPEVLLGIQESGFEYCTPIQAETLPKLLAGRDVAGQAQTGTGKTAAFLVAMFQHLLSRPAPEGRGDTQPRALILAPTRELAIQIDRDARLIGRHLDLRMRLVYGGTGYESQRRELQAGVDVLIGTPGRIIDYLKQGIYSLDALQVVVLDEADRMFDLGFIKDIRYLFRRMPKATERLNMLFSATLSLRVNELAYEHMNNPRMVKIETDKVTVEQVTQRVYYPANEDKLPLLLGMLREAGDIRTVVFLNTKHQSETVADRLMRSGVSAGVLSGDVPQKKRERLLEKFKAGEVKVLVATDVAARGLHIPDVSLVVNYDLPQDPEDYVHRIGRTARAGAAGDAVSFACETYAFSLPEIESFIGQKIEHATYTPDMLAEPAPAGESPRRDRKRGREERRGAPARDARSRNKDRKGREGSDKESKSKEGNDKDRKDKPGSDKGTRGERGGDNQPDDQPSSPRREGEETRAQESAPAGGAEPRSAPAARKEAGRTPGGPPPQSDRAADRDDASDDGQNKPGRKPQRRSHEIPAVG